MSSSSETVGVACPSCGNVANVATTLMGRKGKCPKCQSVFVLGPSTAGAAKSMALGALPPQTAIQQVAVQQVTVQPPASAPQGAAFAASRPDPVAAKASPAGADFDASKLNRREIARRVMGGFQGPIVKPETTGRYQLGAVLIAGLILLLPLVYIALIVLAVFGVYWHLTNNFTMLEGVRGRGAILAFLIYLAPAIAASVVTFFMLKPFFAPASKEGRTRRITQGSDPLLWEFVFRIADIVGAPRPSQIEIDCDVNASASFLNGAWGLLTGRLNLTIGLPLTTGMTVQQLGGVIAHEFGHFSQGAGMRLTFVIRHITMWLLRAAYERDAWDDWLYATASGTDLRISWVLWLSIGSIWVTRKILAGLAWIAVMASGYMLRQMEFDADQYEIRLCGSETFEQTSKRMRTLGAAYHLALDNAAGHRREGRLADNLPRMMAWSLKLIKPELQRKIEEASLEEKTGYADTHPSDSDRIAAAKRAQAPGVYRCDLPAWVLLTDFDLAARGVTHDLYCAMFQHPIPISELHPTEKLLASQDAELKRQEAAKAFYLGTDTSDRPPMVVDTYSAAFLPLSALARDLQLARHGMQTGVVAYDANVEKWREARREAWEATTAVWAINVGGSLRNTPLAEYAGNIDLARQRKESRQVTANKLHDQLQSFESNCGQRWQKAIEVLAHPDMQSRIPNAEAKLERAREMQRLLARLRSCWGERVSLLDHVRTTSILFMIASTMPESSDVGRTLYQRLEDAIRQCKSIRSGFEEYDYPFDNDRHGLTVAQYLMPYQGMIEIDGSTLQLASDVVDSSFELSRRATGYLCELVLETEAALGLPSLPPQVQPKESE